MKRLFILLAIVLTSVSCTENSRARNFGGKTTIIMEEGQRLINTTWKGDDLWLLTEERPDIVPPRTYRFKEKSNMGIMQGLIIIKEQ
jgi:hypothetical protein